MIAPVVFDSKQYVYSRPPDLGERVRWELRWNESFARRWSALKPDWRLSAALRPADKEPVVHLGGLDFAEDTEMQPAIASRGPLRIAYTAPIPVPASLDVSGALRVTATTTPRPHRTDAPRPDPASTTVGTVERLQLVSVLIDWEPVHNGWIGHEPAPGAEWFYELATAPEKLHHYRPAAGDPEARAEAVRNEILLVDLAVQC